MTLPPITPATRLDQLRLMRDFIDQEITAELGPPTAAIIDTVADLYDVSTHDILGRSQSRHVTAARHAAAWLMRRRGKSFRDIGLTLGFHHTTAVHAYQKIERSPGVRALILSVETQSEAS